MVLDLVNSNNTGPVFLTPLTFIVYTKTAKTFFKIFVFCRKNSKQILLSYCTVF